MKSWYGIPARRFVLATMAALVVCVGVFPAAAAAEELPTEEIGPLTLAPSTGDGEWSRQELENAEPLPIVELPGSPQGAGRTAGVGGKTAATTAAAEGIEIGAAETNLFPSRVNGKLFGEYVIPQGESQVKVERYQCSASVVPSRTESVILTAAHCVIDPATGTVAAASSLIFIPAYREGVGYGRWQALSEGVYVTESWSKWAKKKSVPPNEGEDLAFLRLDVNRESKNLHYGEPVQKAVEGSLGISFEQACSQTYTQFGYPAESPYGGEILYSHFTTYAGTDLNPAILPKPVKIASDFTRGASGGPWTIGPGTAPSAVSVTAYGYENQPGYLYGPYFGEAARKVYERAAGKSVPAGIEETCYALPEFPFPPPTPPTPTPTPSTPTPPVVTPPSPTVSLNVTRVHRRANGSAVLIAKVNTAGVLALSGSAVRKESLKTTAAGKYRLVVAPKPATTRRLRQLGKAKVGVKVAFSAFGETTQVKKKIALSRAASGGAAQPVSGRAGRP